MFTPEEFYSLDYCVAKFGEKHQGVKLRALICAIHVSDAVSDLKFDIKINTIKDVVKGIEIEKLIERWVNTAKEKIKN